MKNEINLTFQHPPLQMPYSYGNTIHEHAKRINFLPAHMSGHSLSTLSHRTHP